MSYRIYMKIAPKAEVEALRACKNEEELRKLIGQEDEEYLGLRHMFADYPDFEFGSWVNWTEEQRERLGRDIFLEEGLKGRFEGDFYEIGLEGLEFIIDSFRRDTQEYYNKKLEGIEKLETDCLGLSEKDIKYRFREFYNHFYWMDCEWRGGSRSAPYVLNRESKVIVSSDRYEYAIFELVRMYKDFDEENDAMVIYGW